MAPPQDVGADLECGKIEFVELVDFMCHKYFQIKLQPHLNFITGPNGSKQEKKIIKFSFFFSLFFFSSEIITQFPSFFLFPFSFLLLFIIRWQECDFDSNFCVPWIWSKGHASRQEFERVYSNWSKVCVLFLLITFLCMSLLFMG